MARKEGVAAAAFRALPLPLGAVAGGLYMAGISRVAKQHQAKERARRARRSRMVQTLMSVCAFLAIEYEHLPRAWR